MILLERRRKIIHIIPVFSGETIITELCQKCNKRIVLSCPIFGRILPAERRGQYIMKKYRKQAELERLDEKAGILPDERATLLHRYGALNAYNRQVVLRQMTVLREMQEEGGVPCPT